MHCSRYTPYTSALFSGTDRIKLNNLFSLSWQSNDQTKQYVHMLNSTLPATERTLCCILQNYQRDDGVQVPEVLLPYLGGKSVRPSCLSSALWQRRQKGRIQRHSIEFMKEFIMFVAWFSGHCFPMFSEN